MMITKTNVDMYELWALLLLSQMEIPSFLCRSNIQYPCVVAVDTMNKIYRCHLQISYINAIINVS